MLIHEAPEGEGKATLCCGTFPSLLRSGDLLTEHAGIVTCDRRVPRCPDCNGEAGYLGMTTVQPNEFSSMGETVLTVEPCMHSFTVRVGLDAKIRLEKTECPKRPMG
jgi:hypothetical protein